MNSGTHTKNVLCQQNIPFYCDWWFITATLEKNATAESMAFTQGWLKFALKKLSTS